MNIIEITKRENADKLYTTKYNGEEIMVKVIKCHGDAYDLVRIIKDDETGYEDRHLSSFMYISEMAKLEFKEIVDWSKIPVDTKLLVSDDGKEWSRRHFAKYENGRVYCFNYRASSFSIDDVNDVFWWKYAKLYQE